jgi:hypothetical protein
MKAITVTISPEIAQKMLAICEGQLVELRRKAEEKTREIAGLKKAVSGLTAAPVESLPIFVIKNPESGRARKGESGKAILVFVQTHRGSAWSATEIARQTGTKLSTTIRELKKLAHAGTVDRAGNNWGIPA